VFLYPYQQNTWWFWYLCRVYTCRFDNQVPNEKLVYSKYIFVFQDRAIQYTVYRKRIDSLLKIAARKFEFKTWKSVFTNVRFRSWLSKPLSVTAALINFMLCIRTNLPCTNIFYFNYRSWLAPSLASEFCHDKMANWSSFERLPIRLCFL